MARTRQGGEKMVYGITRGGFRVLHVGAIWNGQWSLGLLCCDVLLFFLYSM